MNWFKCFVLSLLAVIVSTLLAPILPLFAVMRFGSCGNSSYTAIEPRLPVWLSWFDNPDNSLWGDYGWQKLHCRDGYGCYYGMVLWLWRNKAGGFAWDYLGAKVTEDITYEGDRAISDEPYKAGKLTCKSGSYWQFKYISKPIGKRCIYINFGWLLDAFINNPFYAPKAKFLAQIQFPTMK